MGSNPAKQGIALKGLNKPARGQRSAALGSERHTLSICPLKGVHKCSGQRPLGNIIQLSRAQNLKLTVMRETRDRRQSRRFTWLISTHPENLPAVAPWTAPWLQAEWVMISRI